MGQRATDDAMWAAIASRDAAFDGQFVCAVVTTGIFCRPSCSARTPLRQNVRFYSTCETAIAAGFRPCKRCRPTEASREGEVIYYALRQTALGLMMMAATERGVCFVAFNEDGEMLLEQLKTEFPKADISVSEASESGPLNEWIAALDAHLTQRTPRPDLPLDLRGTAFQMLVWRFLLSMEGGETLSYGKLAEAVGKPKATRAVASACGANTVAVLVPCHRIVREDGGLGGYRWGLERKRALLELER